MAMYILLILLCIVAIHVFNHYGRVGRMANKIPGPRDLPIIGNLLMLYGNAEYIWYILHKLADDYYPIFKVWKGIKPVVCVRHPDDLEALLTSKPNLDKGNMYNTLEDFFQDGVFISNGEKWQSRRRLLAPAFHFSNLKRFIEVTNDFTDEAIEQIGSRGKESDQKIYRLFYKLLLRVFCDASLEIDLIKYEDNVDNYMKGLEILFGVAIYRIIRPYIYNWMMPYLSIGKKERAALKHMFKLRNEALQERREFHERTNYAFLNENHDDDDDKGVVEGRKKKLSLIDHLLLAERKGLIDEQGVKEEIDNMLAAGHETTAAEVIFVIMLLAENKEAQELARKEATEVLDKTNGRVTKVELPKLEYTERCIKEALRLYPVAPFFAHYLNQDLHLKNYTLPAGIEVMVLAYATHRDPNFWPNPNKFDPDRFLPHMVEKRHPFSYVPFSAGPRNCMGQKLAMVQLKIIIAKILYNFYLEPIDFTADMRFNASVTLHPIKPVSTKFIKIRET